MDQNEILRDTLDQTAKLVGAVDRYMAGTLSAQELTETRNDVVYHLLND